MSSIEGRWALITGSTRGIGRETALALARLGCHVIVHGRTLEHTREVMAELANLPVNSCAVAGALDTPAGVQQIIAQVGQCSAPHIDILYNNAAIINTSTSLFEFTAAEWQRTFQVNLLAMVEFCSAFAPGMRSRKWGRIINLTSGIANQPDLAPYSASKAAVDKYTQDLAWELKDDNVLVNCVDPGWIRTQMGGPNAWEEVETVIPGVLVPALLGNRGASGKRFSAQDYRDLLEI